MTPVLMVVRMIVLMKALRAKVILVMTITDMKTLGPTKTSPRSRTRTLYFSLFLLHVFDTVPHFIFTRSVLLSL